MTLNVIKEKLTILNVQFDNYEDFNAVWYAVGSSMIEDFTPTTETVLELKIMLQTEERNYKLDKDTYITSYASWYMCLFMSLYI